MAPGHGVSAGSGSSSTPARRGWRKQLLIRPDQFVVMKASSSSKLFPCIFDRLVDFTANGRDMGVFPQVDLDMKIRMAHRPIVIGYLIG
jgi:hypothetical protein